jgi:hypothetical protein
VICAACGTENERGVEFCTNCRRYLDWGAPFPEPPVAGAPEDVTIVTPPPQRRRRVQPPEGPSGGGLHSRAERAPYLTADPEDRPPQPPRTVAQAGVAATLTPAEIAAQPGQRGTCEVRVANTGTIVDQILLTVEGAPAGWASVEPAMVNLYPDSDPVVAEVAFVVPRTPATPTGPLRFAVRATSKTDPSVSTVTQGVLDVAAYYELSAELLPQMSESCRHAEHTFVMHNRGNATVTAPLAGSDPNELLVFAFEPQRLQAPPGGDGSAQVRVLARRRLWFGAPQIRPFKVAAVPEVAEAPALTTEAQMRQRPILPPWAVKAGIILVPLLMIVAGYFLLTSAVPNVANLPQATATGTLAAHGFAAQVVPQRSDTIPSGNVVSTLPVAGARKRKGSPVQMFVSSGKNPVTVPNVANLDATTANAQLLASGFVVAKVFDQNALPTGTVVSTDPPGNAQVAPGTAVTMHVSSGPNGATGAGGVTTPGGTAGAAGAAGSAAAAGAAAAAGPPTLVAPGSLAFPDQAMGKAGPPQSLTVANQGPGTLTVTSLALGGANGGDFAVTGDTCSNIAVLSGKTCTMNAVFTPTGGGPRSAMLSIISNGAGSPKVVGLSGNGLASKVSVSPAALSFGGQRAGTSSGSQTVTMSNSGTGPLTVGTVSLGGANASDFVKKTDSCSGATVPALGNCAIAIAFQPAVAGSSPARAALLTITDDSAGGSQHAVDLSGTSLAPMASLSTTILTFSTTGKPQVLTLVNAGNAPLNVGQISVNPGTFPADYSMDDTCSGHQVGAGGSCTVAVTLTALIPASCTYTLSIPDDSIQPGSPQVVTVRAKGTLGCP